MELVLGVDRVGVRGRFNCRELTAVAAAVLAALVFPAPRLALAEGDSRTTIVETQRGNRTTTVIDHDDDWDERDDYNRTLLQMQRESLSSQEEQARESGRAQRRAEIEEDLEQSSAAHEAYFDAILQDSQAALRAPAGVYYRKPGFIEAEGPSSEARPVLVGDLPYLYDQGIFWLQQGSLQIVVTAPFGAVVDRLPRGVTRIAAGTGTIWYFFGTFFGEKGGAYEIVRPPAGTTVFYLPDGYTQEKVKGVDLYRFGELLFRPVFIQGVLAYQVAAP